MYIYYYQEQNGSVNDTNIEITKDQFLEKLHILDGFHYLSIGLRNGESFFEVSKEKKFYHLRIYHDIDDVEVRKMVYLSEVEEHLRVFFNRNTKRPLSPNENWEKEQKRSIGFVRGTWSIIIIAIFGIFTIFLMRGDISKCYFLYNSDIVVEGTVLNIKKVTVRRGLDYYRTEYKYAYGNAEYVDSSRIYAKIVERVLPQLKQLKKGGGIDIRVKETDSCIYSYPEDYFSKYLFILSLRYLMLIVVFVMLIFGAGLSRKK